MDFLKKIFHFFEMLDSVEGKKMMDNVEEKEMVDSVEEKEKVFLQ